MGAGSPDLFPYIQAICDRFEPADNEDRATHKLSTKEVADAINALNPDCRAGVGDTYKALREAGFEFCSPKGTSGLHFKWLMIEK